MKNFLKLASIVVVVFVSLQWVYADTTTGNIYITATLDSVPWPTSGNRAVTYTLSGPSGDISNSSVPSTYTDIAANEIYSLNYISGGPSGATLHPFSPISPTSSQFLPAGASISFNLTFVSSSNLCPLISQQGRTIISFEPYKHIGSRENVPHSRGPYSINPPLPAGAYDITLVAHDSHLGPGGSRKEHQPKEQYYLKLFDQSSNLITSTGSTDDIPDDQDFVTMLVNTDLQTTSDVHKIEVWHGAYRDDSDYNSLRAICAAFDEPFDYSLLDSGDSVVTKTTDDAFTQNTITKTLTSGTAGPVNLSVSSSLPSGVTASISNQGSNPTSNSTITFTVSTSTLVGTYPITVTGTPFNKQTSFNLVVSGNPMTVSCSASPMTALIGETVTWTATVSGGTPPLTYSWSGTNIPTNPAPNTNPFSIVYSTIGQKTTTVTVTGTDSVQVTCPASVVQVNFDPRFEEL